MNASFSGFRRAISLTGKNALQKKGEFTWKEVEAFKPQQYQLTHVDNNKEQQKNKAFIWFGAATYLTYCTYVLMKAFYRSDADLVDNIDDISENLSHIKPFKRRGYEFTWADYKISMSIEKQKPDRIAANEISLLQKAQEPKTEIKKARSEFVLNSPVHRALKNPNLKNLRTLDLNSLERCLERIPAGDSYNDSLNAEDTLFTSIDAIEKFILDVEEGDQVKKDQYIAFLKRLKNNSSQHLHSAIKFKAQLSLENIAKADREK